MSTPDQPPVTHWQAFISYGFRPFFLFAVLYAAIGMMAWLAWIGIHALDAEIVKITISMPPHIWHAHEMLFGYGLAVIAGFFLTAVPSWTSTRAVQGTTLVILFSIWLAGRIAIWMSAFLPVGLVALIDLAFIPALFALVLIAVSKRWSTRNSIFLPILGLLFIGNLLVHGDQMGWFDDMIQIGHRLTLDTIVLLVVIIGGRVIPAFTTNALRNSVGITDEQKLPKSHRPLEVLSIGSVVVLMIANVIEAPTVWLGAIALIAAVVHAARLSGWQGHRVLKLPIVWILHIGYLWLVIGFALLALSAFSDVLSEITALHAITVGGIGSITVGVLTRAGLGHTGRPIIANRAVVTSYVLLSVAAATRVLGPNLLIDYYNMAMGVSGLMWIAAYALLVWQFLPILISPRASQA